MEAALTLKQLADNFAILQCIYTFTHAQDKGDVTAMAAMIVPNRKIKFDLSGHLPEIGCLEVSGSELSEILKGASTGWTATQHPVWNPIVILDSPTRATVDAMVEALHTKGKDNDAESVRVRASWHLEMEQQDGEWYMADMAMTRKVPIDNLTLLMQTAQGGRRQ